MNPARPKAPSPPPERLINLTPHEVAVQAFEPPADDWHLDQAEQITVRFPSEGRFARVDDETSQLGRNCLNAGTGIVTLTRLRRSAKIIGLPPPAPGTRLLVSRITALAAIHRHDLVFPYDELRDQAGQITGARGLAAFRPVLAPLRLYRDWRAAARGGLAGQEVGQQWQTGVLFAAGTALLSGFLALIPGAVDNALHHDWAGGGLAVTSWSSLVFLLAGGTLLVAGTLRWRKRGQILTERGTAYIIDEIAIPWLHEEKESVFADIRAGFARTLLVPSPDALGDSWQWKADAQSAPHWDGKVDQLVRSFWTVHYNDDQITRNALFTWAPWPVAMAFAARATGHRRGLVLNVRQRPSYGAAGPRRELCLTAPAHDFLKSPPPAPLQDAAPEHTVTLLENSITLTINSFSIHNAHHGLGSPAPRPAARYGRSPRPGTPPALLLLVRTTHDNIGTIPLDLASLKMPVTIHVPDRLAGSLLPDGRHQVAVAEWRLDSAIKPIPQLPWKSFPAAASEITRWIIGQTSQHPHAVVLLATRIPQELAIGLGIQLAQHKQWPQQVYPVYFEPSELFIPDLKLGRESISTART